MRSKFPNRILLKTFINTPDLILPLLNMSYRKHRGVDRDYKRGTGVVLHRPYQISIRITNACNHRCAVCGQYGKHGYMHGEKKSEFLKTLPYEKYKELVDDMAKYKPIYYITGGEPFLYPDIVKLMNYIKQRKSILSVVTNGVKLKEYAHEIVKNNWDMILVSFDGPEKIHDACRGVKGSYSTAVNGLAELKKEKKAQKKKKPYILTSLTLSQTNVTHIEETLQLNTEIMPYLLVVYLSWFTSEDIGKKHSEILKSELDVDTYTWQSYTRRFSREELQPFVDAIDKVRSNKWAFDSIVVPDLKGEDVRDYYLHPEKMFNYSKCPTPFMMVDIMPNGDVMTCRDFIDVKVGNINESHLLDIWNNERFVNFRKLLIKKGGILPQCSRCCGLMGF